MTRYLPLFGFLTVLLLLAVLLLQGEKDSASPTEKRLPALSLRSLDGKRAWDSGATQGEVTLLNFFASWCTPCIAEMPELAAVQKEFPQVRLQGVAWNDDAQKLRPWLKKHGNPFDGVWIDSKGSASIALGIKGIPETLVVDRQGIIRYRLAGPLTVHEREERLAPLLRSLLETNDAP